MQTRNLSPGAMDRLMDAHFLIARESAWPDLAAIQQQLGDAAKRGA